MGPTNLVPPRRRLLECGRGCGGFSAPCAAAYSPSQRPGQARVPVFISIPLPAVVFSATTCLLCPGWGGSDRCHSCTCFPKSERAGVCTRACFAAADRVGHLLVLLGKDPTTCIWHWALNITKSFHGKISPAELAVPPSATKPSVGVALHLRGGTSPWALAGCTRWLRPAPGHSGQPLVSICAAACLLTRVCSATLRVDVKRVR